MGSPAEASKESTGPFVSVPRVSYLLVAILKAS